MLSMNSIEILSYCFFSSFLVPHRYTVMNYDLTKCLFVIPCFTNITLVSAKISHHCTIYVNKYSFKIKSNQVYACFIRFAITTSTDSFICRDIFKACCFRCLWFNPTFQSSNDISLTSRQLCFY